jgi:hypothetical protein
MRNGKYGKWQIDGPPQDRPTSDALESLPDQLLLPLVREVPTRASQLF